MIPSPSDARIPEGSHHETDCSPVSPAFFAVRPRGVPHPVSRRLRILTVTAALAGLALVAAAPSYAVLAAPTPDTTDVGLPVPAFHWTAVSGAAQYQFQLSATPDFTAHAQLGIQDSVHEEHVLHDDHDGAGLHLLLARARGRRQRRCRRLVVGRSSGTSPRSAPTPTAPADGDTITYPTPVRAQLGPRGRRPEVRGADRRLAVADRLARSRRRRPTTRRPAWLADGTHWWAVAVKDANNVTRRVLDAAVVRLGVAVGRSPA